MVGAERLDGGPRSAIVIGAGIVGLSTAWFLQERGVQVTVVDRSGVAAGASWGNAGWVAPALTIPLNQPAVLRYAVTALRDPNAALHIPMSADPGLAMFLLRFAAHCRRSSWRHAVQANVPLNEECIEAYDVLTANGVEAPTTDVPITAVFRSAHRAEHLLQELRQMQSAGQPVTVTALFGDAVHERVPLASPEITAGLTIEGQRFIDPGRFVGALARSVRDRGAEIQIRDIDGVHSSPRGVELHSLGADPLTADAAVVATGAWLSGLIKPPLRVAVRAGRGYSFTVPVDRAMPSPVYLPDIRVACTPYQGAMRVAGTMEFCGPDDPVAPERIRAMVDSTRPLLDGARWEERRDIWVGPRPVTPDGRALIGEVSRGVYVAGGHGMWGLAHGPITGRLLAEQITTGKQPVALRPFDPLR